MSIFIVMNARSIAFLLALLAAIIYGVSFTVAKSVMPVYIQPFGFILTRVMGAAIVFWIIGLFLEKEKIAKKDFSRIFLAAFFGIALNMLSFFKGLSLSTPISASVIMVTSPIMVLIFSSIIIKEKVTKKKVLGILLGLLGAVLLIVYSKNSATASNATLGNILLFINASSYGMYLIVVKKLTEKYHPLVLAKWIYLFGLLLVLPFGYREFTAVSWTSLPNFAMYSIGFVVLFTTVLTYMFNLFAIRKLKATTLSIFIYLQPVIASIYALIMGSDTIDQLKIIATLLIFMGVFLVTRKPKTNN